MDWQEKRQEAAQLADQLEQEQHIADFRRLMDDPVGRRFMWRLLGRCRIFMPSIGPSDAATNFNEGQRNVGLFLLGQINQLCPAHYAVMAGENAPQMTDEQTTNTQRETDE